MRTGRGAPDDSCDVGVPSRVNIANRHFVVHETIGGLLYMRRRRSQRRQEKLRHRTIRRTLCKSSVDMFVVTHIEKTPSEN